MARPVWAIVILILGRSPRATTCTCPTANYDPLLVLGVGQLALGLMADVLPRRSCPTSKLASPLAIVESDQPACSKAEMLTKTSNCAAPSAFTSAATWLASHGVQLRQGERQCAHHPQDPIFRDDQ